MYVCILLIIYLYVLVLPCLYCSVTSVLFYVICIHYENYCSYTNNYRFILSTCRMFMLSY